MNTVLVGKRKQKSVWLDEGMIELVSTYGDKHNLNFSRTLEALALLGLQDTKAVGNAWMAFNMAGGSKDTLGGLRQKATLQLVAELREGMRDLTRIVLALAATERQIPFDDDATRYWNALTEASGVATERQSLVVEQLLEALDSHVQTAAQARLQAIFNGQREDDAWASATLRYFHDGVAQHAEEVG